MRGRPVVAKETPSYLKIHVDESDRRCQSDAEGTTDLERLCRSFEQATGWPLRYVVDGPQGNRQHDSGLATSGRLAVEPDSSGGAAKSARVGRDVADQMAAAVNDLLTQHQQALHALRQREAELATGVPVVSHGDESRHLAARLEAVAPRVRCPDRWRPGY